MRRGTSTATLSATIVLRPGKIVNRKLTVSVSTIIRSTKFAVIIRTLYLSCDSSTSSVISTSETRPANSGRRVSAMATKLKIPHVSKNAAIAALLDSVATMTANARTCGRAIKASRCDPCRAGKPVTVWRKCEMRARMTARPCPEMTYSKDNFAPAHGALS